MNLISVSREFMRADLSLEDAIDELSKYGSVSLHEFDHYRRDGKPIVFNCRVELNISIDGSSMEVKSVHGDRSPFTARDAANDCLVKTRLAIEEMRKGFDKIGT